jgi:excisionase family DNA binding protein
LEYPFEKNIQKAFLRPVRINDNRKVHAACALIVFVSYKASAGLKRLVGHMMGTKRDTPAVFTVCEVAKILRIGKISAYQAIARGDIPCIRIGRRILVPGHALELVLNEAPRPVDAEIKVVDEDEGAWLIEAVTGTRFYIPVVYDLCTGLRRGEILAQRWQDIDFEGETLVVAQSLEQTRKGGLKFKIPKSKKRRRIAIPPLLIEALKQHREEQDKNRKLFGPDYKTDLDLIVALPDGSPWKSDSFTASYARFAAKIGLKGVRFHGLRHSHASHLLRQRVPVKTVQERLGHANASFTLNIYAHMLPGDDQEAAGLIDKRLRAAMKKQSGIRPN